MAMVGLRAKRTGGLARLKLAQREVYFIGRLEGKG